MSERTFTLTVASSVETGAVRIFDAEINASITDCRFTTRIDGGFEGLEVGLSSMGYEPVGELDNPLDLPYRAHLELWDGDAKLWEGRAGHRELGADGRVVAFTGGGYLTALGDDWVRDTTTTAITSGEALRYAIQTYAPYLNVGNDEQFILPTINVSRGLKALYKLNPGMVADIISRMGSSSNELLDVQVWEDRTVWMQTRVVPASGPRYVIPFDRRYVQWSEDPSAMASEVTVEYTVSVESSGAQSTTLNVTTSAENTAFLDRWGFQRKILIAGGELSASEATALRDRELATRSEPTVQATISLSADAGTLDAMTRRAGGIREYALVRAGEYVTVANRRPQPIIATTIDLTGESATYELGSLDPSLPKNQIREESNFMHRLAQGLDPYFGRRRGG